MNRSRLRTLNKGQILWNPSLKPNYFNMGGKVNAIVGAASAAVDTVAKGVGKLNEVSEKAKAKEEEVAANTVNVTTPASTDDLLNQWSSWTPQKHIGYKDLMSGNMGVDMLQGATSGASAGMSFGAIGAGIGAGVGLLSSGLFGWAAKRKAKKKAKAINKNIDANNLYTQNAFGTQAEQLDDEMTAQSLANFTGWEAAYGGPLFAHGGYLFGGGGQTNTPDYDRTLQGRLTNYAENPDSVGFDRSTRRWYSPALKGYDPNNRGMGVDVVENSAIKDGTVKLRKDTRGRTYLTEKDERTARHRAMEEAESSYKQRVSYANDHLYGKNRKKSKLPSELKKALLEDLIYYRGSGYVARNPFEDDNFMRTLLEGSDQATYDLIKKHYKDPTRAKRITEYLNSNGYPSIKAFGGDLMTHGADFETGLTLIGNGGSHEENPLEGVPMGTDAQGIPNLVEEGETIFNDYVFSKRLKVPKTFRNKYKLGGTKSLSFAEASLRMAREAEERPNDPISQRGLEDSMAKLMIAQEQIRARQSMKKEQRRFANGGLVRKFGEAGPLPIDYGTLVENVDDTSWMKDLNLSDEDVTQSEWWKTQIEPIGTAKIDPKTTIASAGDQTAYLSKSGIPLSTIESIDGTEAAAKASKRKEKKNGASMDLLRFAPALNQGIQALTDALGLTNRPKYTLGKRIREANNQVRGISTRSAGTLMGYRPTDQWAAINNFNAQMSAQRSALRNSGNRVGAAGQLLASAYNQNRALGELYAGMERENWNRLTQTIAHNTSVDQANRSAELQASQANAAQGNVRANNLIAAARADDAEEQAYATARAANRNAFFDTLGSIGKERIDRGMMKGLIESGVFGTPNEAMLKALQKAGYAANGGRITRKKKKKGLTY